MGAGSVLSVHHPWRAFRELTQVTLRWMQLPEGLLGFTDYAASTVTVACGLTQAERRCTIAHETEHVRRGPVTARLEEREERHVDDIVSRRLISFAALAQAMLWARDAEELADELWVDVRTVRARLRGLTPQESIELNRRLGEGELRIP